MAKKTVTYADKYMKMFGLLAEANASIHNKRYSTSPAPEPTAQTEPEKPEGPCCSDAHLLALLASD